MIIKCSICGKEFDKPSHRNQHERDAHRQAMTNPTQPSQQVPSGMTDAQIIDLANGHEYFDKYLDRYVLDIPAFARALLAQSATAATEDAQDAARWRELVRNHGELGNHEKPSLEFAVCVYDEGKRQWFYMQTPLAETVDAALSKGNSHE